jgi:hypothetical protein
VQLVMLGMWLGLTLEIIFVVTEYVANIVDRDPEVTMGQSEVNNLVNTSLISN